MSDLHQQLQEAFQEEWREHLEGIGAALAATPVDLEEAFRRAHSLKAAARVCDLGPPTALAGRLETLFGRVRQGKIPLESALVAVVQEALDTLADWLRAWEAGVEPAEPTGTLRALDEALSEARPRTEKPSDSSLTEPLDQAVLAAFQIEHREHLEGIRLLLAELEEDPNPVKLEEAFRRAHSLKGAARLAELGPAETIAHRLETLFAQVREGELVLSAEAIAAIHHGLNCIEDAAACLLEGRPIANPTDELEAVDAVLARSEGQDTDLAGAVSLPLHHRPSALPSSPEEAVRLRADHLDRLLDSAEQLLIEGLNQEGPLIGELGELERAADELVRGWEALQTTGVLRQLPALPTFLRRFGEQAQGLARRARRARRLHKQGTQALSLLGRQLHEDVRQARTVPAESVYQGFRKMVRDLAGAAGKEIDFQIAGLDLQADRLVLQALKDPLIHLLRNAVYHGIEPPEERRRQGKSSVGQIALRLEAAGTGPQARAGQLQVVIQDDGRGLDLRQVGEEAVRRGLLRPTELADTPAEALAQFVFLPGFSTAKTLTELAGRGMGLSVVRETVRRLQGEVCLSLPADAMPGIRIQIAVPLSLSALRLLLVCCGGQTFAIPVHGIERLHRIRPEEVETLGGRAVLSLGGESIPLRRLADLLGLDTAPPAGKQRDSWVPVVLLQSGSRRLAVVVDTLLGDRVALLKNLDPIACGRRGGTPLFAGGTLLADGSVCLVLSPAGLFDAPGQSQPTKADQPVASREATGKQRQYTILVVDDSLTTRTLERSILEAHGYRVRLALDGLEALARLRDEPVDLVITDIQMPRLDGFGLLEQMKKEPPLARIPVIVVTSLERREDQERGLALGADAYIVKRKFDHEDLLETVRQIL